MAAGPSPGTARTASPPLQDVQALLDRTLASSACPITWADAYPNPIPESSQRYRMVLLLSPAVADPNTTAIKITRLTAWHRTIPEHEHSHYASSAGNHTSFGSTNTTGRQRERTCVRNRREW